ncbi:MAG: PepSY domain-containing protein [Gammaproteobacteria bacterium]|nr:PepSY domain-containing protein [Gammaproteobacteria bacterium]
MKVFFRKLHRWLGLLVGVQIIAWMASGLYFSLFPIEEIRGENLTRPAEPPAADQLLSLGPPSVLKETLDRHLSPGWALQAATVVRCGDAVCWRISGSEGENPFTRLVSADGSRVLAQLDAGEARRRAADWLREPGEIDAVSWLEGPSAPGEIRGRPLPVWRIDFRVPKSLSLYLDPWTGEVLARRTDRWRLFDFFWMLHIMDFEDREDFNHPLLQVAAGLGLVVALSGIVFWAMTTRLFRRRRVARS